MLRKGGFSTVHIHRLSEVLHGYVERGEIAGVVAGLARRGDVHVEVAGMQNLETRTPMRRDGIFRIASMTKPIAAVAAMILVEERRLRLDEPVDRLLPELGDRRVLKRIEGPLDETVPAKRAITLRDLLTFTFGFGATMQPPGTYPIQKAAEEAGLAPGPFPPAVGHDEFMRRLGELPLMYQPGERWMYHTGADVLAVLAARTTGMDFEDFLRERIFAPLGMTDTGFSLAEAARPRLTTC